MKDVDLVMIGFGNVGRAFAKLLEEKRETFHSQYDLNPRITGILTKSHGGALDPLGIDTQKAIALLEKGEDLLSLTATPAPEDGAEFIQMAGAQVLLENTPVNYSSGQPAIQHIETALSNGLHAITANKGPVVHAYQHLTQLAAEHQCRFFFESTVMDGAPIFSLWRSSLPAGKLQSFRGVLNSTTNLILTLMEEGKTFEQALHVAQDIGIAETDPSGDLEGWDAAVKVAALTIVLMDQRLLPVDIDRAGIDNITAEDVMEARRNNQRWKLVCEAKRTDQGVTASVKPVKLGPEDALFNVMGTSSAITFYSDVLGALTVLEEDPGPRTTAYGLLADLLNAITLPVG